jgi:hypothetical protein
MYQFKCGTRLPRTSGFEAALVLLLVAAAGAISMTDAERFWWLAPTISGLAVIAVVWFQWGQHKVHAIRGRRPFRADMTIAPYTSGSEYCELHVPPHREVSLQLRVRPTLHYRQLEFVFGFWGNPSSRPVPVRVFNEFIKVGKAREQSPDTNSNHYIDQNDRYHIREELERTTPNVYTQGFIIQTKEPGRYPVLLEIITDSGEAKPKQKLVIIVEERPYSAASSSVRRFS